MLDTANSTESHVKEAVRDRIARQGDIVWRQSEPDRDDVVSITCLLHAAYAALGKRGLNYTAVDQSDKVTLRRLTSGIALLGCKNEQIIATGTLYLDLGTERENAPSHYRRPDCAFFGQFAVHPDCQHRGLGSFLCRLLEDIAQEHGKQYLALDTAEPAVELIAFYGQRTDAKVKA